MTSNCRERERQDDVAPAASQKWWHIKLKTCTAWKSVRYCNMLHARRSIDQNTNDHARKDSLNYMTKFCTSSLLAATMVIAPLFIALSATDPSSSIWWHVAAKRSVAAASMPTSFVRWKRSWFQLAHSAGSLHQIRRKKPTRKLWKE